MGECSKSRYLFVKMPPRLAIGTPFQLGTQESEPARRHSIAWQDRGAGGYDGAVNSDFIEDCLSVLTRTPATLDALLCNLPEAWTAATEGPGTWSPYVVVGHLIHAEKADWMPRLAIILEHGASRPFEPFDREAQFRDSHGKSLPILLHEFRDLRQDSIASLRAMHLTSAQLDLKGTHPELGPVTARQLIATWTAHDLGHLAQISRVMAKRYKEEVGPWAAYLSVMK